MTFDKPRLLLFDDNEDNIDITQDTLEEEFEVTWTKNKEELDSEIEHEKFVVIVTDVSIETSPEPGFAIIDEIRRKYRIIRTPVVVYSAVRNVEEIKINENRLFFDYILKRGRGWQEKLLNACIKAAKSDRNFVGWNAFEASFEKIGRLDEKIASVEIPDAFFLRIDLPSNATNRTLIAQIKNPEIDDITWELFEKTLWKRYERYLEAKIIS